MRKFVNRGVVVALVTGLWAASCTKTDHVFRSAQTHAPICQAGDLALGARNNEKRRAFREHARCFIQGHQLPDPQPRREHLGAPAAVAQGWRALAEAEGAQILEPDRYDLSILEVGDDGAMQRSRSWGAGHTAGGRQPSPQLVGLFDLLQAKQDSGRQNVVVVLVHGWRHDAALRDGDLEKLRTLMGYSRAALNARCIDEGRYCKASLTGVFLSWRGRTFDEPPLVAGEPLSPFVVGAVPTVWDRKRKSNLLGGDERDNVLEGDLPGNARLDDPSPRPRMVIEEILDKIEVRLRRTGGRSADKMLIVGHSFGGNILATVMEKRALKAINRHRPPSYPNDRAREMKPVLGDLVVLLNPAAEAARWTLLQRAMRQRAGLKDDEHRLVANEGQFDPAFHQQLWRWSRMFPMRQRPVYLAITSAGKWHHSVNQGRRPKYDTATGVLFPLFRKLAGFQEREQQVTIGHLNPSYRQRPKATWDPDVPKAALRETLIGPPVGTSHEFAVTRGIGKQASYGNAGDPLASWCAPATGWLYRARRLEQANGSQAGSGWEFGYLAQERELLEENTPEEAVPAQDLASATVPAAGTADTATADVQQGIPNIGGTKNQAHAKWSHSLSLPQQANAASVASARSPFWNVRAYDSAIREHAGWVSYPTWCAINQLLLDDVGAGGQPSETVKKTLRRQQEIHEVEAQALEP